MQLNAVKFNIGDEVRILPNIRLIESMNGRNPSSQCLDPSHKDSDAGRIGTVTEIHTRSYRGVGSRDIYTVDFGGMRGASVFHPEWLEAASMLHKSKELDSLFDALEA